jgi:hypothetical protein
MACRNEQDFYGNLPPQYTPAVSYAPSSTIRDADRYMMPPTTPIEALYRGTVPPINPVVQHLQNSGCYRAIPERTKERKAPSNQVVWDGKLSTFPQFKNTLYGYMTQAQISYLITPRFILDYRRYGTRCLELPENMALPLSERQLALDIITLYGVLVQACSAAQAAQKVLLMYKSTEDGILAYDAMIAAYNNEGHKTLRAEKAEAKLQSAYTLSYPGGLSQFIDDYQTAFAVLHGECGVYYSDETQKRKLLTNLYHESTRWLVHHCRADPSLTFQQCCDLIQQDALRHDLRSASEATASARKVTTSHEAFSQILNTMKTNIRLDDAAGLTLHPELWQLLTPEMRTTLIQLRKTAKANIAARRQLGTTPSPGPMPPAPFAAPTPTAPASPSASTPPSLPSQYGTRAAQQVTSVDDVDSDDGEYEDEVSTLIHALEAEYDLRHLNTVQTITVHAHVDYLDRFAHLVANSAYGPTICVSDSGADTTVIGEGWHIDHFTERRANLVGFDKRARKEGLPIVTALTIVQTTNGMHLLRASDVVYNQGSSTTLLSEFQLREHGCLVDSVLRRHDSKSTQSSLQSLGSLFHSV